MRLTSADTGAETELWNADGSRAEVSGNGVRCAAAWVARQRGLQPGGQLVIGTVAGPKRMHLLDVDGLRYTFRAEMGPPTDVRQETINVAGTPAPCVVLRVGNPQCIVLGPASDNAARDRRAARGSSVLFRGHQRGALSISLSIPHHIRILIGKIVGSGRPRRRGPGRAPRPWPTLPREHLTRRPRGVARRRAARRVDARDHLADGRADSIGDARFWT